MIHILGLLLKTIGWILLGVLGIILGILLLVLFSAIGYKVEGRKQGQELEGQVKITWLLWILSALITYQEGVEVRIRLFGQTIRKLEVRKKAGGQEDTGESGVLPDPEPRGAGADILGGPEDLGYRDAPGSGPGDKRGKERARSEEEPLQESVPVPQDRKKEKGGTIARIRGLWVKLCAFFRKLLSSIRSLGDKAGAIREKLGQTREKWEKLQAFLQDPANQRSAELILRQTKKVLRHLSPRKGRAQFTFGLEDPYQMGQILSAAAFFYPFTRDILTLSPVFDEKLLEGEVSIKGHIRIGMLLGYMLRLLLDANIRKRLWRLIRPSGRTKKSGKKRREDPREKANGMGAKTRC